MSVATPPRSMAITDVRVVDRHRRDLGDLTDLQASIQAVGLLHPVVVTGNGRLVAGQRRLEACRQLGWSEIPVSVAGSLDDARALLAAERDENVCRLDMKPSEKVALGLALEELERPKAEHRMTLGKVSPGSENGSTGKVHDLVGEAVGMSGRTYRRAKAVVTDATDESLPAPQRTSAEEAMAEMDATGKVSPAYNKVSQQRSTRPKPEPKPGAYKITAPRHRQYAEAAKERVERSVGTCNGLARGLDELHIDRAVVVATADEIDGWDGAYRDAIAALKRLRARLKECSQ